MNRFDFISKKYKRPEIDIASYTEADGSKYWFKDDKFVKGIDRSPWYWGVLHRVDGPAIEWASGSKEWWLNGKLYLYRQSHRRAVKKKLKNKTL